MVSKQPDMNGERQPMLADFADETATLETPLFETTFCVIDLETTGTTNDSRITEIGAVKVCGGEVLGEFQTLINPGVSIPSLITTLTGISNQTVADAPHLRSVFPALLEFVKGCVMVAHNARFDIGFLKRAAKGLGYDWPGLVVVDTVALARHIIPRHEVANYRLGTLSQYVSTTVTPSHRALDDAQATVDLLHALLDRVGNQGVRTLEDLLEFSHLVSKARRSKGHWAKGLPKGPGVYFFVRDSPARRQYLYVGTSKAIRRRVATYFTASEQRRRMEEMIALATGVEAVECQTSLEAAVVELRLIAAHQPPYNRRSKQPSQIWVKLTDEPIPRFSIVRKVADAPTHYLGPFPDRFAAEQAILAASEAFPLRTCKERLTKTGRQPCALAELKSCPAPCEPANLAAYGALVEQARDCLAGNVRPVRKACFAAIDHYSSGYRYEEAAEMLARLRIFEYGLRRKVRLVSLASCPEIIAARRVGESWLIHIFRYAQLVGAAIARPGDDPSRIAEIATQAARCVTPEVAGMPAGSLAEAELIAAWMEKPGVRLMSIDGVWGWPTHSG
ncbi:MAG: DEDD exonuclease domain-containing protein [Propionibacteriaceae bacterium]|jgi:DNA polymerase-3 subunit epsilon|nr:DEDD exonuclease domain-containing protein [Propionibacteriaceae bacterium]